VTCGGEELMSARHGTSWIFAGDGSNKNYSNSGEALSAPRGAELPVGIS
jgi:hypothetical protein